MTFHNRFTLAASLCLATASYCAAQPAYTATALPADGSNFNRLEWLSSDGTLGFGETGILMDDGTRIQPCVQYKNGTFTKLPTPNFACTGVRGNNAGAFTGTLIGPDASSGFQAFLYQNGTFTLVAPLQPGENGTSFAQGINSRGDVAGYANRPTNTIVNLPNPDGTTSPVPLWNQFAFIYSGGQLRKLDGLANGAPVAMAMAINDAGDAAGSAGGHAVLWPNAGGIQDLGVLPGDTGSVAMAINSNGMVAGLSHPTFNTFDPTVAYHAFLYDGHQMTQLSVPGVVGSSVIFMNDSNEVLVSSYDSTLGQAGLGGSSTRPFYYKDGQAYDLNTLVTNLPAGVMLNQPVWINNAGQILAISLSGSTPVEYILTPQRPNGSSSQVSSQARAGR